MAKVYRLRNKLTGWEGGVTRKIYEDRIDDPEYEDASLIHSEPEYDNEQLPESIPHRARLVEAGYMSAAQVAAIEEEGGALEEVPGIGPSYADDIRQYLAMYSS